MTNAAHKFPRLPSSASLLTALITVREQPKYEINTGESTYDLDTDTLTLCIHSETFSRHYSCEWRLCEAERGSSEALAILASCPDDDPDYEMVNVELPLDEVSELRRWLEAYDGPGSADAERARLLDAALTTYDPT